MAAPASNASTLYNAVAQRLGEGRAPMTDAVTIELDALAQQGVRHVPGYGHRFHPLDPRAPRLLALVDEAAKRGVVGGRFAATAAAIEAQLAERKPAIPMNIDGATAVVYAELGFPAAARPRAVRAVAFGRRPGPRL